MVKQRAKAKAKAVPTDKLKPRDYFTAPLNIAGASGYCIVSPQGTEESRIWRSSVRIPNKEDKKGKCALTCLLARCV